MSVRSRSAFLLGAVTVAAGLLVAPGPAYAADLTTEITRAEMKAAMQTVAAATAAASETGWSRTTKGVVTNTWTHQPNSYAMTVTLDAEHHRSRRITTDDVPSDTYEELVAEGVGTYKAVNATADRAALDMIGRSEVRYQLIADTTASLEYVTGQGGGTPAAGLTSFGGGRTYGSVMTRVGHDDGSVDYRITSDRGVSTMHVSAAAILTGFDADQTDPDNHYEVSAAYSYGPQTVDLPAASVTIDARELDVACVYRDMAVRVSDVVHNGARLTLKAANGGTVTVAGLRRTVRREADRINKMMQVKGLVQVRDIASGARVSATNPWTKKTVTSTVTVSGRKIAIKKA